MTSDDIELFSKPDCPYCRLAREYLASRGLNVRERDVSRGGDALRDMLLIAGHAAVPVIRAGRQVLVGFDSEKLDRMIRQLGDSSGKP
jgi:glutaredoxin 3